MSVASIDELALERRVAEILNRRAVAGLAIGVVGNGSLDWFHAHGLADVASKTPVTQDTVFRIASISKTFTAVAVMQLWERGLVDLDAPANDYLRAYRLVPADPAHRPATVRHLMTHTSGIGEQRGFGDLLRPTLGAEVKGGPVPPLAEIYRGGLRPAAEPGTRFTYTDHGVATLGQIVEDVSGEPFDVYLRKHVFGPLGMESTDTRRERMRSPVATGYVFRPGGLEAVVEREFALGGAGFVYSTTTDMARYAAALLGEGGNEHGSVLRPETLAAMFEPHYQPDPRVPGIGLAFFRAEAGGHRVVEHQGILPGFTAQLVLASDDGIGIVVLTNTGSPAPLWLPFETEGVLRLLLGVPERGLRTDVPQHPETWSELCGRYVAPGPLTDVRARSMVGAGVEVFVRRGQLVLRALTPVPALLRGFRLHPDDAVDPDAFRIDLSRFGLGSIGIVFGRDASGRAATLHLDAAPLTLERRPATLDGRRVLAGALAFGVAATVAGLARRRSRR